LTNKTHLIQIGNVNESEWVLTDAQKFEFIPNSYLTKKKKYLLEKQHVLISLTGGSNTSNDISSYFEGSFKAFLNQRVSAFSPINNDINLFFYFYALTKSLFFKNQWLGKGGIQKNTVAKERDNTYLPIIDKKAIEYISQLTQAIINKEKLIKQRYQTILETIENELKENQKLNKFKFDHPTINDIMEVGRLDTNLYSEKFKSIDFLIKNYINGFQTIFDYGFTLSRGQNLQVSNIGTSIYSTKHYDNFYTLMLPKFLSKYGTVDTIEYLGNAKKLKTLEKGDLIIGAEGFEKGRSIVIIEEKEKTITNIHGITIQHHNQNLTASIFIKCCLDYLRDKGLIDLFAVGGNGGSLAQKYWEYIPFPNFDDDKQKEIAKLYHNADHNYEISQCTLDNFLLTDQAYNEKAGIHELDKTAKHLKAKLNQAIDDIINDKEVDLLFNF
jgi:hypothetical protein